jgi:hypothetical protein
MLMTTASGQVVFVRNMDLAIPPTNAVVEAFPGTGSTSS